MNAEPMKKRLTLHHLGDTQALAEHLAPLLMRGDRIGLGGALGAGKTTFAQYLVGALSEAPVEVASPTFTLLYTYPVTLADGAALQLWHYDLYRVEKASALTELGLDEAFGELALIEWPERLGARQHDLTLMLDFSVAEDGERHVAIAAAPHYASRFQGLLNGR